MKAILFLAVICIALLGNAFAFWGSQNGHIPTPSKELHLKKIGAKMNQYIEWSKNINSNKGKSLFSKIKNHFLSIFNNEKIDLTKVNQFNTLESLNKLASLNPQMARNYALHAFHSDLTFKMNQQIYIVQFNENINNNHHYVLETYGIKLDHYIPDNAFLVVIPSELAEKIQKLSFVSQVVPFTKDSKIGSGISLESTLIEFLQAQRPKSGGSKIASVIDNFKGLNGGVDSKLGTKYFGEAIIEPEVSFKSIPPNYNVKNVKLLHILWLPPHSESKEESDEALKNAQQEWINSVYNFLGESSNSQQIHHEFKTGNIITFSSYKQSQLDQIATLAIEHSYVYWVEISDAVYESELKFTVPLTKTGTETDNIFKPRGLTGKNVKIGIADSGVDVNSCLFYDTNQVPFIDSMSENEPQTNHRKLISYWRLIDDLDEDNGHGSHVSSIALGNSQYDTPLKEFNGVAEDSKLVFLDFGCSKVGGCKCDGVDGCPCTQFAGGTCAQSSGALYVPNDFQKYVLGYHKSRGASISSFSLGNPSSLMVGYNSLSNGIDKFAYENDHLILFSAGNSGSNEGFSTLTGPYKETKNTIVVGAESSSSSAFLYQTDKINFNTTAQNVANAIFLDNLCDLKLNQPNTTLDDFPNCKAALLIFGAPSPEQECCNLLSNCTKSIIDFFEKIYYPYSRLEDLLERTCCKKCVEKYLQDGQAVWGKGSLATFSSIGPSLDGRIKPDVVAIGMRVRATNTNSGTCTEEKANDVDLNVRNSAGTSMATPVVAGSAALIYQYFQDGFYPTGEPVSSNKFKPSASLVKAMIIESARPLPNYLRATPAGLLSSSSISEFQRTFYQGFGSINLQNVLKMKDVPEQKFKLYISDDKSIKAGEQHLYMFVYDANASYKKLGITLAWTDPPAEAISSHALVNNLDLVVFKDDKYYNGNNGKVNDPRLDHDNNVEKLQIDVEPGSTYAIYVRAANIATTSQKYSLVVTHGAVDYIFFRSLPYGPISNVQIIILLSTLILFCCCCAFCCGICYLLSCCGLVLRDVNRRNSKKENELKTHMLGVIETEFH